MRCEQGTGRAVTLSSFVTSLGKNVRKYAEVGFQRLVVALPTRLSSEELDEYTALVTRLCDKCQVRYVRVCVCDLYCVACMA